MDFQFEVIDGKLNSQLELKKIIREKRMEKWKSLYFEYKYGYNDNADNLKAVYYGVKYYSKLDIDSLDICDLLRIMCEQQDIKTIISQLTLNDLMKLFPIIKDYDGRKYECKDYYSTMEYIQTKNIYQKIGIDGVDDFFWNYYNSDIMNFSVKELIVSDRMRRLMGKKSIMESFIEDMGLQDEIHTYTYNKIDNVMIDNVTGESIQLSERKNIPKEAKYFKIVENNDVTGKS